MAKRAQEYGEAIKKAELEKCRTYYSEAIKAKIAKNYNLLNLYADRADKVMIAYNLWKQSQPVPPIVDTAMDRMHNQIFIYRNRGLQYLAGVEYWNDIEFTNLYTCKRIKQEYLKLTRHYSDLDISTGNIYDEKFTLRSMKRLIKGFTDETPFDDEYIFYLSCSFDDQYLDNLTPETWPKDENGKSIPVHNCETTANPFSTW